MILSIGVSVKKMFYLFLFLICFPLSGILINMANAGQYELTVENGSGSGVYEEGSTVIICAAPSDKLNSDSIMHEPLDVNAPIRFFDTWTGDISYINEVGAAKTTLVMPTKNLIVTAEYLNTDRWVVPLIQAIIPQPHIGIILFLHGQGGSAANLTFHEETRLFIGQAVARGYGVIAIDSYDKNQGAWDEERSGEYNVDMQRIAAMRNTLIATGEISETDLFFLAGISMGGVFASRLAEQSITPEVNIPVAATALFVSKLAEEVVATTRVPTIFIMAENDKVLDLALAKNNFSDLIERQIPTQLFVLTATPLHPHQFWNIDGLTRLDSETIYNSLDDGGFLSSDGLVSDSAFEDTNADGIADWQSVVPEPLSRYAFDIEAQLIKSAAGHGFYNDYSSRVFSFFDNPTTILDILPEITNFEPVNGPPSTMITINGANFAGIGSVSFNGVQSEFSIITSSVIRAKVPTAASTGLISVTNAVGTAMSSEEFTVLGPKITKFLPEAGVTGSRVVIYGENFIDINQVTIGGIPTEFVVKTNGIITITVPLDAVTGPIVVSNFVGETASSVDFVVPAVPEISEFYPSSGIVGTYITLVGVGFAHTRGIYFGRIKVPFEIDSDTQVRAMVPENASSCKIIIVTLGGRATSTSYFRVID